MKKEHITTVLIIAVVVLSFQTIALAQISKKLSDTEIGVGVTPSVVSFSDDGSAPDMVGGC